MTMPIAPAGRSPPLSPPLGGEREGDNLLAQKTPSGRTPVIDKMKVDPKLREAAEGMEAMFLDQLMKTMRQTVPKSELSMDSPGTEIYRSMLDTEIAQKAAKSDRGIGLAEQIIAYMVGRGYNQGAGHGAQPSSTGGTHAGQSSRE